MKSRFLLSLLTIVLCSCSNISKTSTSSIEDGDKTVQVVLMYGQSNMEGNTWTQYLSSNREIEPSKLVEYTRDGYSDIKIAYELPLRNNNSDYEFVPVKCGQGLTSAHFGPEVGMADVFHNANLKEKVYLIKWAWGGSNLYNDWRSPSFGNMGSRFSSALDYTSLMLSYFEVLHLKPIVKAICWMQGEADACSASGANNYETNEKAFINDLRDIYSDYAPENGEIAFIDAGISDSNIWSYQETVNQAKQNIANEDDYCVYLDTQLEGLDYHKEPTASPDLAHYDSNDMIELGHMFGNALVDNYLI